MSSKWKLWDAKLTNTHNLMGQGDICDGTKIFSKIICKGNNHIASNVTVVGRGTVHVGKNSTIAPGVVIYTSMPNRKMGGTNKYVESHESIIGDVIIGDDVFIGVDKLITLCASPDTYAAWQRDNTSTPPGPLDGLKKASDLKDHPLSLLFT